jgi:hypothetical protein
MRLAVIAIFLLVATASATDNRSLVVPTIRPAEDTLLWVDLMRNGRFEAQGTWTTTDLADEDNLVAYPINLAEIVCRKEWQVCLITQASITDKDWFSLRSDNWNITRWTNKEIVAVLDSQCITSELTINVPNKQAFIVEREGGTTIDNCKTERQGASWLTPLTKPRVLALQAPKQAISNDPRVKRQTK